MLDGFFRPKSVAVIGASRKRNKVGHVILKNLLSSFKGKIFPINPNAKKILGKEVYPSVLAVKDKIDTAIIAVRAETSLKVVEECGKKGIKNLIIITSGFAEVGNYELRKKLLSLLKRYKLVCLGPNILGTLDTYSGFDCLFLPRRRMMRPRKGNISFITQSGAIGSAVLDLTASEGYGFAKFVSYGNALQVDESDLLEYFGRDENTKIICMYIEGVKSGKKFLKIGKKVAKRKPVIVMKGGLSKAGSKAILSHTGSLAGSSEIYSGVFKQAGMIQVFSLEEMFDVAKILDKCGPPAGDRVQVITNGGGHGILCVDAIIREGLKLAEPSEKTVRKLREIFPPNVIVSNPMDLLGDATDERYRLAINACLRDKGIDIILIVLLYQTPLLTERIVKILGEAREKPIVVVSTGGKLTEKIRKKLEEAGLPCYLFPSNAVRAIKHLVRYYKSV